MINMKRKNSYTKEDLLLATRGQLDDFNFRLPTPPLLMVDRILTISDKGGKFDKGEIIAEFDINPELWFFQCHFLGDPVMPGCLELEGLWQMTGFLTGWIVGGGRVRAIGVDSYRLLGPIYPNCGKIIYHVHMRDIVDDGEIIIGTTDAVVTTGEGKTASEGKGLRLAFLKS